MEEVSEHLHSRDLLAEQYLIQITVNSTNIVTSSSLVGRARGHRGPSAGDLAPAIPSPSPLLRPPSTTLSTHRPRLSLTTSFPLHSPRHLHSQLHPRQLAS
ncbi:hypothetical protein CROQUDRAFT_663875 [Cronartium quercuum f. sp. fusiforme G11]|uniref:Uncharacterized protein n=1 Tax=Cronartium quercuum f. sp. fusiforme G11 TaxID=708437 RepID=A0A9P6T7F0_9BASI|nr:hypothetical protein CROQUDRAFT_663875 [Cronartium quercuum f. sp. fusiforme G11]